MAIINRGAAAAQKLPIRLSGGAAVGRQARGDEQVIGQFTRHFSCHCNTDRRPSLSMTADGQSR